MAGLAAQQFQCPTTNHGKQQVVAFYQEAGRTALYELACGCQMPGTSVGAATTTGLTTGVVGRPFGSDRPFADYAT